MHIFLNTRRYMFLLLVSSIPMISTITAKSIQGSSVKNADTAAFFTWTYEDAPMGLFLPASSGKQLPVVMFLHGCNNDPVYSGHWIISALNKIEPCAVFLPTALETQNTEYSCADWGGTYDPDLRPQMRNALHELDSLIGYYGFDPKRQYIYGESMGGEGVFMLLTVFSTRFAGAIEVAGYTLNKGADKMAQTPLWIHHGSADQISPIEDKRVVYNEILSLGGTHVQMTEYSGLSHVAAIERVRTQTEPLAWLFAQVNSNVGISGKHREQFTSNRAQYAYIRGVLSLCPPFYSDASATYFDLRGKKVTGRWPIQITTP